MSRVIRPMSHVMCHMSHVTCHVSCVTCHFFFGQSGEAYRWWVCYQRSLPRLAYCDSRVSFYSPFSGIHKDNIHDEHLTALKVYRVAALVADLLCWNSTTRQNPQIFIYLTSYRPLEVYVNFGDSYGSSRRGQGVRKESRGTMWFIWDRCQSNPMTGTQFVCIVQKSSFLLESRRVERYILGDNTFLLFSGGLDSLEIRPHW